MKSPRLVAVGLTCVSLFAFGGCSASGDTAITVDNTTFTSNDVDLLANFQCDSFKAASADPSTAGQVPKYSRAQLRSVMASVLVASALNEKLAKRVHSHADPTQVASQMQQLKPQITKYVRSADRDRVTALLTAYISSEVAVQTAVVAQIGQATLQQLGQQQGTQAVQEAEQAGRLAIAKKSTIDVDPIYGLSADGLTPAGGGSISSPVSTFAKESAAQTATQSWLAGLPTNQRCV